LTLLAFRGGRTPLPSDLTKSKYAKALDHHAHKALALPWEGMVVGRPTDHRKRKADAEAHAAHSAVSLGLYADDDDEGHPCWYSLGELEVTYVPCENYKTPGAISS